MKPSIGRIVHVKDSRGVVCAAIITEVHSDDCVNVTVFHPNGPSYNVTSVIFAEELVDKNQWSWPPRV